MTANATTGRAFASVWNQRRTLLALARHDARRAYAGTTGGRAWTVLTPLIPFAVLAAVFSLGLRLDLVGAPFVFGFAAAYVPWVFLSSAITASTGSIVEHRYLVKRVRFPVHVIPAAPALTHTIPHLVLLALTAIVCFAGGYGGVAIATVPYFYLCAVVLAFGGGLLLASLAVIVRDVTRLLPAVLQVWFWVTPIAYAVAQLPSSARDLIAANPASYVVTGYRHALMPDAFPAPTPAQGAGFWLAAVALLAVGAYCYRRLRPHFWECL